MVRRQDTTQPVVTVFTDGASRGNPGPGGWGAVVSIVRPDESRVVELGGAEANTTNNRMELTAAVETLRHLTAYKLLSGACELNLYTDSRYLIHGVTRWMEGWKNQNWRTARKQPVERSDLWKELDRLLDQCSVSWHHVRGHSGLVGNERADAIATAYADAGAPHLYSGPRASYPYDIESRTYEAPKRKTNERKGKPAHSYVSMVGGEIRTHRNWADTKERVNGVSGARYKKALSPDDERAIIEEFRRGQ